MKRIWLVLAVVMSAASGAGAADEGTATVIFNLRTMAGAASARALTLQPSYVPLADTARTNIFWSPSLTVYPTNPAPGMATVQLAPNVYTVTMVGAPGTFRLTVGTNDVGTTNYATAMSTNLLAIATVPQFVLSTNAEFASYATNAGTAALALNVAAGISNAWRVDATNAARAAAGEVGAAGTNHVTGVSNTLYAALQAVAGSNVAGVASFELRTGAVTLESNDVVKALGYVPGAGGGTGWKLVEPEYAGGGTNTFAPVYQLSAGADIIVTPLTNVAGGGLYTVNTQWMELDREIVVWTNAAKDVITRSPLDEIDDIYVLTSKTGATNFDATTDGPGFGTGWGALNIGGTLAAKWFWTTNYVLQGWGLNGQVPEDGAVLAWGTGLDYTTNGGVWTVYATNIPARSLGTSNAPAAGKVLTVDAGTNLYWGEGGGGTGQTKWPFTAITNSPWVTNYQSIFFVPDDGIQFVDLSQNPNLIISREPDIGIWAANYSGYGTWLSNLNASALSDGTVPLARLSGITSNQLDAGTWLLATNSAGGGTPPGWCDNLTNWCSTVPSNFTTFAYSISMSNYFQRTNPVMILHSDEYIAWQTNGFMAMHPGVNRLGLILSNGFSRATMDNYCGVYKPFITTDGTNWFSHPTNVPVEFGLLQDIGAPDCTPVGVSNLVIFTFNNPDRFHVTNIIFSQYLIVDRPKWELQAAPLHTVKTFAQQAVKNQTNWAFIPAQTRVDYHNNHERYTDEWQRTVTVSDTANRLEWQWLQTNIWTLTAPSRPAIDVSTYSISLDSYTNFTVVLPAAYTSSVPIILYTHHLVPTDWRSLPFTKTNVGNTLKITFSVPSVDVGFFKIVLDNAIPPVGTLNGVLEMTPRTITNSNDSTWGKGAGLICVDANYIYVSTGTNTWKRVALGW